MCREEAVLSLFSGNVICLCFYSPSRQRVPARGESLESVCLASTARLFRERDSERWTQQVAVSECRGLLLILIQHWGRRRLLKAPPLKGEGETELQESCNWERCYYRLTHWLTAAWRGSAERLEETAPPQTETKHLCGRRDNTRILLLLIYIQRHKHAPNNPEEVGVCKSHLDNTTLTGGGLWRGCQTAQVTAAHTTENMKQHCEEPDTGSNLSTLQKWYYFCTTRVTVFLTLR